MKKPLAVLITAFRLSLGLTPAFTGISGNLIIEAEAHQGRTDANGGHHDYKNKSGLGSYHYHCGGNPAHLHPNGSALMQAVLLVIPAQLVVLPPKSVFFRKSKSNRNSSRSGFYWLAER